MQKPSWWRRRGPIALLLLPIGTIYAVLDAFLRAWATPKEAPLPLICIGNLTVGGAGKTPVTQALAKLLLEKGQSPAILSRGFGRKDTVALRVSPETHSAEEVGDEPLLHARVCPTYVGADRLETATLAAADGATVLLLDDGLQHHKVAKDLAIEVRNAADGLGNGWPLPAGPLRQWFGLGQRSVDVTILIGKDALIEASVPEDLGQDRPIAAFCGIADPSKFQDTLKGLGLSPTLFQAFGDHHAFTEAELTALRELSIGHALVTTEKDWVRLSSDLQAITHAVPYGVRLSDPEGLWRTYLAPLLRPLRKGEEGDV